MKLLPRVNLSLAIVFIVGEAIAAVTSYYVLMDNAREQVLAEARLIMESSLAVRNYTSTEIAPLLRAQMQQEFLPQSVPSYSATVNLERLRVNHAEYTYKEATLNPTNLRDRATDWEADIVQTFRNDPGRREIVGQRDSSVGQVLYLARPLTIQNGACLSCHSVPTAAPRPMLDKYGSNNGFGWQLHETVGSQIVSVPADAAFHKAANTFKIFLAVLTVIMVAMFLVVNLVVRRSVVRPIVRLSALADQVSAGDLRTPEFDIRGDDEIAMLGRSFTRMRKSLEKALAMLDS